MRDTIARVANVPADESERARQGRPAGTTTGTEAGGRAQHGADKEAAAVGPRHAISAAAIGKAPSARHRSSVRQTRPRHDRRGDPRHAALVRLRRSHVERRRIELTAHNLGKAPPGSRRAGFRTERHLRRAAGPGDRQAARAAAAPKAAALWVWMASAQSLVPPGRARPSSPDAA